MADDHQLQQQQYDSSIVAMSQPELSFGLTLAVVRKNDDASADDRAQEECKFDDVMALQEEPIQVKFVLPDDSTITHEFKKGHTIMVLKCFLEEECELDQSTTLLYFENQLILDPFSLTDFKAVINARHIEIGVRHGSSHGSSSSPSPSRK